MKKIFVIVVTYKGGRWYDRCFGSLRDSEMPVQVVAVDNSPGEEDAEYIKTHFPEAYLIKTNENLGFGRANNLGMRYALDNGCDYVFLLNQDAWLDTHDTLNKLVEIAEQHPEYGILSPMHLNVERMAINMQLGIGAYYRNEKLLSDLYIGNVDDVYETNFVNAAAWLLPRKTLETIGGFCPLIRQYGEDDDYIHRVLYHGMKVGVIPYAQIVHDSKQKVSGSKELYDQAQKDDIDGFLDITNPIPLHSIRSYLFRKCIISWFKSNKQCLQFYQHRYRILRRNYSEIQRCRKQHKIKQANWL